ERLMTTDPDKVEAALQETKERRGYISPVHRVMAENDLKFFEIYNSMVDYTLYDDEPETNDGLALKYREIVICGLLAFRAGHFLTPNTVLVNHIKRALAIGATQQEMFDAFKTATISGGMPAFIAGVQALELALAE